MKKAVKWAFVAALGLGPVGANAATYDFSFSTTDSLFSATGAITTGDTLDAIGGYDVLSISGTIFGPRIGPTGAGIAFAPNPSQPFPFNTLIYQYDNVYFPGGPAPLMRMASCSRPAATTITYIRTDRRPIFQRTILPAPITQARRLRSATRCRTSVTSAPEPSTWALILLGFAGLGLAARRKTRGREAALALQPVGLGRKA